MQLRAKVLKLFNQGRVLIQAEMRFRNVSKRFLDLRVPQLGVAAQSRYRTQIERHILPAFGELKMCEIDSLKVSEWLAAKAEAGLSWWTRIDLKGVLSAIFTAAKQWNMWEKDNPSKGVRIGEKKLVRKKPLLTVEQLRAILLALQPSERFLVQIIFGLGLRVSEVLGLFWCELDLEAETVFIHT
jgi:integrase